MKKTYIIPSTSSIEIRFEGLMEGTVTDVGGDGPGYGGPGTGGGRTKDYNDFDPEVMSEEIENDTWGQLW